MQKKSLGHIHCAPGSHCSLHTILCFFTPTENIVYNGFLLIVINTLLMFMFGILSLILFIFFPLLIILFLTFSIGIWYHFGAAIYRVDKDLHLVNALFSVLVGVTPLLFLTVLYQISPMEVSGVSQTLGVYLSLLLSIVSTILMPVMVIIGTITHFMRNEKCL